MNKKLKRSSLLLLPLGAIAISTPLMVTACAQQTVDTKVDKIYFDPTKSKSKSTATKLYLDPNVNNDAQEEAQKTFKEYLDQSTLQTEFDRVLTKFYQAYEFNTEVSAKPKDGPSKVEIEADIEKIKVKSFDKSKLEAKVDVTYEVETEQSRATKDGTEKLETQEKTFKVKPKFATKTEISQLTQLLTKSPDEQQHGNTQIDLEDLKELYVGDPDDNEKSIFEEVAAFNESNDRYGGLLGYEVDLTALEYTSSKTKATQTTKPLTKFFAPSFGVKKFFVPQMENYKLPSGLDLTLSYDKLRVKTESELITNESTPPAPAEETTNNKGKDTLWSLLADQSGTNKSLYEKLVQSVSISTSSVDTNMLDVQITLKSDAEEISMPMILIIGIQKSWLRQATTTTL